MHNKTSVSYHGLSPWMAYYNLIVALQFLESFKILQNYNLQICSMFGFIQSSSSSPLTTAAWRQEWTKGAPIKYILRNVCASLLVSGPFPRLPLFTLHDIILFMYWKTAMKAAPRTGRVAVLTKLINAVRTVDCWPRTVFFVWEILDSLRPKSFYQFKYDPSLTSSGGLVANDVGKFDVELEIM